jgi:hypothetical protein
MVDFAKSIELISTSIVCMWLCSFLSWEDDHNACYWGAPVWRYFNLGIHSLDSILASSLWEVKKCFSLSVLGSSVLHSIGTNIYSIVAFHAVFV